MKREHFKKIESGGSLLVGKRRTRRLLDPRVPQHLVLKATHSIVLLQNKRAVETVIYKYSRRMRIKIFDCGVHADHVHLAIGIPDRETYVRWIRALTSVLVQKFAKLKWKFRPYTRVGEWGQGFARLKRYIRKNHLEGELVLGAHRYVHDFRQNILNRFSTTT